MTTKSCSTAPTSVCPVIYERARNLGLEEKPLYLTREVALILGFDDDPNGIAKVQRMKEAGVLKAAPHKPKAPAYFYATALETYVNP